MYLTQSHFQDWLPMHILTHPDHKLWVKEAERDVVRFYTSKQSSFSGASTPVSNTHAVYLQYWKKDFDGETSTAESDEESRFIEDFREAVAALVRHRYQTKDLHEATESKSVVQRSVSFREGANLKWPERFAKYLKEYDTREWPITI